MSWAVYAACTEADSFTLGSVQKDQTSMEYRWESREQEEHYAAIARGFESREAMHAFFGTLASAKHQEYQPSKSEWRYDAYGHIRNVDPADWDDDDDYERRLERATKA